MGPFARCPDAALEALGLPVPWEEQRAWWTADAPAGTERPVCPRCPGRSSGPGAGTERPVCPPHAGTERPVCPPHAGTERPVCPPHAGTERPVCPPHVGTERPGCPPHAGTERPVCPPQVQCHSYTGYCWCVTPNGRPISGTAVAHKTPRCPGRSQSTYAVNPRRRLLAVCRLSC